MTNRLRDKYERDFQARVLAALEKPQPKRSRFLAFINSPAFLWSLSVFVLTAGGGIYSTYKQCISDSKQVLNTYMRLRFEISYREDKIATQIQNAKTMDDVRKSVDSRAYFSPDYKDRAITELKMLYRPAYLMVDRSGIDESAESAFIDSPLHQRFNAVMYGDIDPKLTDADLPDLKDFAGQIRRLHAIRFFTWLRSLGMVECSAGNVLLLALGANPVTVRVHEIGSLAERQRLSSPINILPKLDSPKTKR